MQHRTGRILRLHLGWGLLSGLAVAASAHAAGCARLTSVVADASTITSASIVNPPSSIGGVDVGVAFCRVQGVARPSADSEIKFEVWLPSESGQWTGRLKVNGTGGFAGATPYVRLAQDIADGWVTAGSNMGHDGGESPAWTLKHPEKVKDWGLRAHYHVTLAAKALSQALYARPVKRAYFEGCSNGGRQAMMMAQNYPALFDGIVAGAPSLFYPDLLMSLLWTGRTQVPVFGQPPVVSAARRTLVSQRVLQACDAADGLADGQITNPRACRFDLDALGPLGDRSLTAEELAVFKAMYAGTTSERGEQRYSGATFGSEADWDPNFADNGGYGRFIGHYVYGIQSPPFEWRRDINFSTVYDRIKAALSAATAAPSPDLSAFADRGGKLIQYHGWNDSVVPPDGSVGYLHALAQHERLKGQPPWAIDRQIDELTAGSVAAATREFAGRVSQYHRLFMLPAVGHCGGGSGPNAIGGGTPEPPKSLRDADHHVVHALVRWVEQGAPPEMIVATRLDASGAVLRQRPVCVHPMQAIYKGSGDINDAANFICGPAPGLSNEVTAGDLVHVRNSLRQRDLILPNR